MHTCECVCVCVCVCVTPVSVCVCVSAQVCPNVCKIYGICMEAECVLVTSRVSQNAEETQLILLHPSPS